ncbi:KN motif and ankyrin repeat domain-containing protein 1-like [Trichomycterus rosablanca]|uniref:KN motif and ankyrin repeat domain-containing protein 1-like n=1 Tax=Trichomycterus rosablanca TaxID=2290929 RepID=UPI002F360DDF
MDAHKVNGVSPKENGSHRGPPSYSVETPYGFHLDLDFLKYVEDIEKGNTIRRVQIQRRPHRRSSGNLLRNLSLPGYGCRSFQWNSSSTFCPGSRLADSRGFDSSDYTRRPEPTNNSIAAQLEATIQAFDEQPLGHHVRPNLLRATSLPLTVLLRKYSESTEDPTSPNGSRDYLTQENGSSEDVFHSPGRKSSGVNGTFQQLTAALRRVGELEEEIGIIPELKAQICILQEERERLLYTVQSRMDSTSPLAFSSNPDASTRFSNKANEDWMNQEFDRLEKNVQASSEQVHAIVMPSTTEGALTGSGGGNQAMMMVQDKRDSSDQEDRTTSQAVESLKKKIAGLEQKLNKAESDLEKTRDELKEQEQQSCMKDRRINELTKIRAKSEKTVEHLVHVRDLESSPDNNSGQTSPPPDHLKSSEGSHTDVVNHVHKVKELVDEQWKCLCGNEEAGRSSEHLPPRVHSIQKQLVTLVDLLSLYVTPVGDVPPSAQTSIMEDQTSTWESLSQDETRDHVSGEGKSAVRSEERAKEKIDPKVSPSRTVSTSESTQKEEASPDTSLDIRASGVTVTDEPMEKHLGEADSLDYQAVPAEAEQDRIYSEAQPEEPSADPERRQINADFMKACHFLQEHMDEVSEPNDEMRQALTVAFQHWFSVAAEEDSSADTVALYLNDVAVKTPAVLQFLVNMVDDNGNTALHYSVSHSNFHIVKLLLDTGVCNVDLKNKSGYTAVMLVSLLPVDTAVDVEVMQRLMELSDVNARAGLVGQTALHLAVRHGRASTVRLLLAHGANINAQDQAGTTALIIACDRGHTDIIQILLEDPDCDINLTDKGGRSALSLATQASHTEIADLLRARTNTKAQDKCKMS